MNEQEKYHFPGFFFSVYIWSILYMDADQDWDVPNHKHPMFEILYCESGHISEWINGVEYELRAGDFIFIHSGALHYPTAHQYSRYFNFHFDVEPREVHAAFHRLKAPLVSTNQPPEVRSEIRKAMEQMIELFKSLKRKEQKQAESDGAKWGLASDTMILQSKFLQFLAYILDKVVTPAADAMHDRCISPTQHDIASDVAYLLETYGMDRVRIGELAKNLNVHRNYLTECFKNVYGMTPKYYLTKTRIEKAKRLLQETSKPVHEIADMLSFSSPSYFCRFFRDHTGTTPHQFRVSGPKEPESAYLRQIK